MQEPTLFERFFAKAGLPASPEDVIGRKFRFFNDEDSGYEFGGTIEGYEISGEVSISIFINRSDRYLRFSAVKPPYGDGIYRWNLISFSHDTDRVKTGNLELL